MSEIVNTLALLIAKQKLVPFMGAGCSASMLPDWNTLINEMLKELKATASGSNLEIAQEYVNVFGKEKFYEFLRNKLRISDFEDDKGYVHLTIMNMGTNAIYTTNQDNVMEKAYEKYGIQHRTIVKVEDFAETKLSEQLYIKFHGDLKYPETIVFTQEDYEKRMSEPQNALNIRLLSDLLAKGLLFIGYSFGDINIQQIFLELRKTFGGKLPESYMIAYEYTDKLHSLCVDYGITLINPMKEFPKSKNHAAAFEAFLKCVMEESVVKQVDKEIKELFTSKTPRIKKTINKQEVELLENAINKESFDTCVQLFRKVCDSSIIPYDYENKIVDVFIRLCKTAKKDEDTQSLQSAIFNLNITNSLNDAKILAALMATANIRAPKDSYGEDMFFITSQHVRRETYTGISAKAIEYVYSWGMKPTSTLVSNVGHWFDHGANFESLPEEMKTYIRYWIDKMRTDCKTVAEDPIKRQNRLENSPARAKLRCLTDKEISLLSALIKEECLI